MGKLLSTVDDLLLVEAAGVREGRESVRATADQWRFGSTRIQEVSERREAFNIMRSMPTGTDARVVQQAASEFAKAVLANHRYVMVLHTPGVPACAYQRAPEFQAVSHDYALRPVGGAAKDPRPSM